MTEWRELLQQSHPGFQPSSGAAAPAVAPPAELEWISPTAKLQKKIQNIPDKFGFKIGEAADYIGVKGYVLRYWEAEFESLKPKKSKNGQRMYTKRDIEAALFIKKLLHEDRFSIEGARAALKQLKKQVRESAKPVKQVEAQVILANTSPTPSSAPAPAQTTGSKTEASPEAPVPRSPQAWKDSAEYLLLSIQEARATLGL